MSKVALHMIVSGSEDPDSLKRCLDSVEGKVDQTFIVITTPLKDKKLKKIAKKRAVVEYKPKQFFHTMTQEEFDFIKKSGMKPEFEVGEQVFEFDKARNYAMSMVSKEYEWLLWLDSDDIQRGTKLREIIAQAEKEQLDSVFLNYIYQAEIVDGKIVNIQIQHLRERLIRNNGAYEWIAPIHETLIEKRPTRKKDFWECDVLHLSSQEKKEEAIVRNIKSLQYLVASKQGKDPRPVYYLGKAYFDWWMTKNNQDYQDYALKLFNLYLLGEDKSGWAEERSQCWEYLVEIYRSRNEFNNAIKACHNAMIEDERFPSIYINLALCYTMMGQFERALFWMRLAANIPQPNSTLVSTPRDIENRALEVLFHSTLNTSKLDQAHAAATKMLELNPTNQVMRDRYNLTSSLKEQKQVTQLVSQLAAYLEQTGQGDKLKPLSMAIPGLIKDNPFMVELAKKVNPPRVWGENEVAIYCGPTFTPWSPKDLEQNGDNFIGGSEEAVIYLSKALTKQGWKVTVYADPGTEEGVHDGVTYLPYYKFNTLDQFNILVGWRRVDLVDQNLKAKKIYIWCHDLQNQLDYTPERLEKIYKTIVLSPFHRTNIPNVPDDKVLVSSNGVSL